MSQIVVLSAAKGLEVRTADQVVPTDAAQILDCADLRCAGAARKLHGYAELTDTITPAGTLSPYQVAHRGDELVAWGDDDKLYSYDAEVPAWRKVGDWTQADLALRPIAPRRGDQREPCGEIIGDYLLATFETTAGLEYAVQRVSDGALVQPPTLVDADGTDARVVAAATEWMIAYYDSAASQLRVVFVTAAAPQTLFNNSSLHTYSTTPIGNKHDAVLRDSSVFLLATFDDVSSTPHAFVWRLVSGGAAANNFATSGGADRYPAITHQTGEPNCLLAGLTNTSKTLEAMRVNVATLTLVDSSSLLLDATDTFDRLVGVQVDEDNATLLVGEDSGNYSAYIEVVDVDVSAPPAFTVQAAIPNAAVSHKPFLVRGRVFAPFSAPADAALSAAYLVLALDTREVLARFYAGDRATISTARDVWPSVQVSGDVARFVSVYRTRAAPAPETLGTPPFVDQALGLVTLDLTQTPRPTAEYLGALSLASGGLVRGYDGSAIYEVDWHVLPTASVAMNGSGGLIPAGSFTWVVYWLWEDAHGQQHRSAPKTLTATAANNDRADITITGGPHSSKPHLQVGIGRSLLNNATTFYEVTDPALDNAPVPGGTLTIQDGNADADISDNEIYDQAGTAPVLPHEATPAARFIAAEAGRLWFGDPELDNLLHYTIPCRDGFGPGITPDEVLGACDGVAANALVEMDGSYFVLGPTGIMYWAGDGPSDRGAGPAFPTPRLLPASVGVTSQLLVAKTAGGILYSSPDGPRLLARSRASRDPFAAVSELWRYAGQSVSRVLYLPQREETVLFDGNAALNLGQVAHPARTLRHAHTTGRWGSEPDAQASAASVSEDGTVVFLRTDATVCQYDESSFFRGSTRSQLVVGSSWFSSQLARPLELIRLMIVGRFLASHNLGVGISYDYDDAISDVFAIDPERNGVRDTAADAATPPAWATTGNGWQVGETNSGNYAPITRYQFVCQVQRKCHAFRVIVWDETDAETGTADSFALTAVLAEVLPAGTGITEIDANLEY